MQILYTKTLCIYKLTIYRNRFRTNLIIHVRLFQPKKKLTKRNAEARVSLVATSEEGSASPLRKPFEKGLT